tara:strand:- start:245 stop:511 length:267 start_codon:yes stop_codon:yes gene_type:complete
LAFLASSTAGVGEERQSLTIEGETAPVEGLLAPPSMLGAPLAVLCVCDRRSVVDRTPVAEEAINRIGTRVSKQADTTTSKQNSSNRQK